MRRHSPFFPFIGGIARQDLRWQEEPIRAGTWTWVVLDLYGTTHDGRLWDDAQAFRPARFLDRQPTPFDLVAQGGDIVETGHR